jgi:hypothetical protein
MEEVKGDDFGRHKDAKRRQQIAPILRRHREVKSQQESEDTGDSECRQLDSANYPAGVVGEMACDSMDIQS